MKTAHTSKQTRHPCPRCQLPTAQHCPSTTCGWRACPRCRITLGNRAMGRDGKTVP